MLKLGIDLGSRNTKIVVFDTETDSICYSAWQSTDISPRKTSELLIKDALTSLNIQISDITATGVTGYGRKLYNNPYNILSEISCHTTGCLHLNPNLRLIIDVGGQDAKIISLYDSGRIQDFVMNDKCAAGTGRFIEMTAIRLGIEVNDLSSLAAQSTREQKLNSTCVVFAESEIIGLMADSASAADIARAVNRSVSKRIVMQMGGVAWQQPVAFTGGVAKNSDLVMCLAEELKTPIWCPEEPEITGALGAAIMAR